MTMSATSRTSTARCRGTADTTRALYNADREQLGTIGPDPDGAGSLKNRAVRNTIDTKGLTTKVEDRHDQWSERRQLGGVRAGAGNRCHL